MISIMNNGRGKSWEIFCLCTYYLLLQGNLFPLCGTQMQQRLKTFHTKDAYLDQ
jgi:hypothetical protein